MQIKIDRLKTQNKTITIRNAQLEKKNKEKNKILIKKLNEVAELKSENIKKEESLNEKSKEISFLQEKINDLENKLVNNVCLSDLSQQESKAKRVSIFHIITKLNIVYPSSISLFNF